MNDTSLTEFTAWYGSLRLFGGFPAKGTMSGALVVLDRLKTNCELNIDFHTAGGGSQIIGASGSAVKKILNDFGEPRPFVSEGGRTNRGLRGDIKNLLDALSRAGLNDLEADLRCTRIEEMQRFLVVKVAEWHDRQRIELVYDEQKTTRDLIRQILHKARERGQVGPIAQYLVGAKLQIRYPNIAVENDSYSTADAQLRRSGDFVVGDTAFHITVSPMDKVYDRCLRNLEDGMRAYLLVPQEILAAARTNADSVAPNRISVESIEGFVGGNIDELSVFSRTELASKLRELIVLYNERVDAVEIDKSMMIDLPHNLEFRERRQSSRTRGGT